MYAGANSMQQKVFEWTLFSSYTIILQITQYHSIWMPFPMVSNYTGHHPLDQLQILVLLYVVIIQCFGLENITNQWKSEIVTLDMHIATQSNDNHFFHST